MPARTEATRVRRVLGLEAGEEEFDLSTSIETANSVVTDICLDTATYTYTPAKLELVERWLAAHFYTVTGGQVTVEQVASLRQQYAFKIDLYLNNTKYGQMAIALDTNGSLVAFQQLLENGGRHKAGAFWLGRVIGAPYIPREV